MYTLPIGLRSFASEYLVNYGAIAAGVVISVIPLLAAYLLFSDVLEKGMVAGALK
jgi:ABC-type glycerol-3-phosphate transport system permease component